MASYITATLELDKGFINKFAKNVVKDLIILMKAAIDRAIPRIQKRVQRAVLLRLQGAPEYSSIANSVLRFELGLPDGGERISAITERWVSGISVIPTTKGLGGISIGILRSDWADVLSMPEAIFSYVQSKRTHRLVQKKIDLEWLRWLLLEGGATIISDYHFAPQGSPGGGKGRAGGGLMARRQSWKVPAQFQGTESDNFCHKSTYRDRL